MLPRYFNNYVTIVSGHSGYERSNIVIESSLSSTPRTETRAFDWHMSLGVSAGASSGR